MAQRAVLIHQEGTPQVSAYLFDERWMKSTTLRVKIFENYSEEWALFVLQNRDEQQPQTLHDYDIVYGPIADDGVTFQIRRYQRGAITLSELVRELRYSRRMTFQYFFGTERALATLKYETTYQGIN